MERALVSWKNEQKVTPLLFPPGKNGIRFRYGRWPGFFDSHHGFPVPKLITLTKDSEGNILVEIDNHRPEFFLIDPQGNIRFPGMPLDKKRVEAILNVARTRLGDGD